MDLSFPILAFLEGVGGPEMALIFVIILVLFGGEKLPDFARGLGKSIREFKKAAAGVEEEFKRALEEDEHKKSAPTPVPTAFPPYPPARPELTAAQSEAPAASLATPPSPKSAEPAAPEAPAAPPPPATPPPAGPGPIDHLP